MMHEALMYGLLFNHSPCGVVETPNPAAFMPHRPLLGRIYRLSLASTCSIHTG